jgi:hypothetical protein
MEERVGSWRDEWTLGRREKATEELLRDLEP